MLGTPALVQVGRAYVIEQDPGASPEQLCVLESAMASYLNGTSSLSQATQIFRQTFGNAKPLDRIAKIVQTGDRPIQDFSAMASAGGSANRKRTRSWTEYENQRLLAGIHRFGTDDWLAVANFVGNGRTRSQCSQRWVRGLDPRISKERWTREEEELLDRLVEKYGTKSWTKIATEIGNRSDVQCRYHYNQMRQEGGGAIAASTSLPIGLLLNSGQKEKQEGMRPTLPSIQDLLEQGKTWKSSTSLGQLRTLPPDTKRCTE
jgi:hypothetical protein